MVNEVTLIGRLGRDPELRHTPNGAAVSHFPLATDETWLKDGERQKRTTWHNIVCWGKLGELAAEYLRKGRLAYVRGSIQMRQWEDKDGNKRVSAEIKADEVKFLDRSADKKSEFPDPDPTNGSEAEEDDIPF